MVRGTQIEYVHSTRLGFQDGYFYIVRRKNDGKSNTQHYLPADEVEALEFYMGEKGLSTDGELQSQMTNLYEKNVPLATRRYLERNNPPEERTTELADEPKRGRSMTDEERREFND